MPASQGLATLDGARQQFQEQIDFFLAKLNLPSERWDDIKSAAHDRAFIVAGAQKADLLNDLRLAVEKSIRGDSIGEFRKDFAAAVQKSGWMGWTGQGTKVGEAWRTRVIYQTNMATSYAAGRWKQLHDPELLQVRPFWRYIHSDSVLSPRPLHKAWGDARLTLRHDHPFWTTHFPPNGWGCHCSVQAVRGPKEGDATAPPDGWDAIDPKTDAPAGIDKGWAYAPGAHVNASLQSLIDNKLIAMDAPIGAAMWDSLKPVLAQERAKEFSSWVEAVVANGHSRNQWKIAGVMREPEIAYLTNRVSKPPATAEIAIEDKLIVGKKADRHEAAGNALSADEWKRIPQELDGATVYFDKLKNAVLYVFDSQTDARSIKIAVEVNFVSSKPKATLNLARAGFKINPQALEDRIRYEVIR